MLDKDQIIGVASDHGGYAMKQHILDYLVQRGYTTIDLGANSEYSVDYPDYIHPLAEKVNRKELNKGIIICGSGNGAQITANKHKFVRAALCWNEEITKLAREHNDANVLALPGRFIPFDQATRMVDIFLTTAFEGGRHETRVEKISMLHE